MVFTPAKGTPPHTMECCSVFHWYRSLDTLGSSASVPATSGTHTPIRTFPKRDSAVVLPGCAPAAPGAGSCRLQRAPAQPARAGAAAVCGLAAVFAVHTAPRFVCLRGPSVVAVAVGMAWAQRAPWLLSAGSAVQALPCPCPCPCRGLCPRPSPSIRSPLTGCSSQKPPEQGPETLPALALSPATASPSFPHSGIAQQCHILPQSMSPYPLSQEELSWAVSPLLPWAQHPCTDTATSSQGWHCHPLTHALQRAVRAGKTSLSTQVTCRRQVDPLVPGPGGQLDVAGHNNTGTCGADPAVLRWLFWAWLLCIGLWPV